MQDISKSQEQWIQVMAFDVASNIACNTHGATNPIADTKRDEFEQVCWQGWEASPASLLAIFFVFATPAVSQRTDSDPSRHIAENQKAGQ
jgi:hypothetical protein